MCFRDYEGEKVWVSKILDGDQEEINSGEKQVMVKSIDLSPMLNEPNDKKFVRFDSLPYGSFLNIKSKGLKTEDEYYNSLVQITLRNEMYVFNLETDGTQ